MEGLLRCVEPIAVGAYGDQIVCGALVAQQRTAGDLGIAFAGRAVADDQQDAARRGAAPVETTGARLENGLCLYIQAAIAISNAGAILILLGILERMAYERWREKEREVETRMT